jgi:murein L,D-transpeptidase YcbB/YkuD
MKRGPVFGSILAVFVVPFISSGCVTNMPKSDTDIQALKTQVTDLETKVQQKDAEIDGLRTALSRTTTEKYNQSKESAGATEVPSSLQIQQALKSAGFYTGQADGKLGRQTRQAIRDFQKAHGLNADGKVGPKTWNELAKYTEKKDNDKVQAAAVTMSAASEKMQVVKEKSLSVSGDTSVATPATANKNELAGNDNK